MSDTGCEIRDARYGMRDTRCEIRDARYEIRGIRDTVRRWALHTEKRRLSRIPHLATCIAYVQRNGQAIFLQLLRRWIHPRRRHKVPASPHPDYRVGPRSLDFAIATQDANGVLTAHRPDSGGPREPTQIGRRLFVVLSNCSSRSRCAQIRGTDL